MSKHLHDIHDETRRTLFWQMLNIILTVGLFSLGSYLIRQGNIRLDQNPEDDFEAAVEDWNKEYLPAF